MIPVEMIFSSDLDGHLSPIKFRVKAQDDLIVVPVRYPVLIKNEIPGSPIIIYEAEFVINNRIVHGKLKYDKNKFIWFVEWGGS